MGKTWAEKMKTGTPHVDVIDRPFAGISAGSKLLISSPIEVRDYVRGIAAGNTKSIPEMRADLATKHGADATCPLTASIFARIVSEAAWDEHLEGASLSEIAPFWRLVGPNDKVATKLRCGTDFLRAQRAAEGTI